MPYQLPQNAITSTQGPTGMGNPFVDFFKRMAAPKPTDIELPAESGQVDPRILAKSSNPLAQLQKAFKAAQDMAVSDDPLEGLRRAGQR